MKPDISIIIPIYNVEKYLPACLDSVINQTHSNIEILLVDDCGTDASMQIARKYAAKDSRIKILTHLKNKGLSAARNTGLQAAQAPFVMFLDSDDYYAPAMCAKMLEVVTSSNADMAICATRVIYQADEQMRSSDDGYYKLKFRGMETLCDEVLLQTDVSAWNKIYRASIIKEHAVSFPQGLRYEDAFFFNAYAFWAKTIYFLPEELYCYRRRLGSIMNQTFQGNTGRSIDHLLVGIKLWEYFQKNGLLALRADYINRLLINYADFALRYAGTASDKRKIYTLLMDFVAAHAEYFASGHNLLKRYLFSLESSLKKGFLLRRKQGVGKKTIRFLGIPVWKERYNERQTRYYFCGIPVGYKTHSPKAPQQAFVPFLTDDSCLLNVLRVLPPFKYIVNPGNMGDFLIAAATLGFFKTHQLPYSVYDNTPAHYIVYGGGGIWTNDYRDVWQKWLPVFKAAKKVVILPSSFYNCPELVDILDERFVIFCREKQSYDYLDSFHTHAKLILDHDMAFRTSANLLNRVSRRTQELVQKSRDILNKQQQQQISFLMRRDCEGRSHPYPKGVDLSTLSDGCYGYSEEEIFDVANAMLQVIYDVGVVVTDRLHVGIAALLLGKETYLLDNSYHKVSNVYLQSLKNRPGAFMVKELPGHILGKIQTK